MATTTIDTDTELSAVNSILGSIGQSPVTELIFENPEVGFIYNLLRDSNVDVQNEGWHFNTEKHVKFTPDADPNKIPIASNILKIDVTDGWKDRDYDVVQRGGFLYDKHDHTYDWSDVDSIDLDVIRLYAFEDIPSIFQRYVTYMASRKAAIQLVSNPQLVQLLGLQESQARAGCFEYECNQANFSYFGIPDENSYNSFQPYKSLLR